jgi:predicted enzyme related to lactoylglutathione lyase
MQNMIFKNSISWFEIPAIDINRAQKFYEAIFDTKKMFNFSVKKATFDKMHPYSFIPCKSTP